MTQPDPSASLSEGAVRDLDRLLNECVEQAGRELAEGGEFWPFALALTLDDQLVTPSVDPGEARPEPLQVVRLLRTALRSGCDQLRAAAVCSDVQVRVDGEQKAALQIELEPREGAPLTLVVPYTAGPVFQKPIGSRGEARIFR